MTREASLSAAGSRTLQRGLPRKLSTFARLPRFTLLWLVPGVVLLMLAAIVFAVLPFRLLAKCLGDPVGPVAIVPFTDARARRRARQIAHLVAVVARIAPSRRDCVPQALFGLWMCWLYRVPAALHFGVRWEADAAGARVLKAHAWLASAPRSITGGAGFADHVVTACFVTPRRALAGTERA